MQNVNCAPNPAGDAMTVSLSGRSIRTVTVRDITGRVVLERTADTEASFMRLDTCSLTMGSYLVDVCDEQGMRRFTHVVVMR